MQHVPSWPPTRPDGSLVPLREVPRALIEASAGTGKTYQTEALVVRLVGEAGLPIEAILVITFTRAATAELRGRVRARLQRVAHGLASDTPPPRTGARADLELHALWHGGRDIARARLERALQDYDKAPISTIHSFCQQALEQHAFEADQDPSPDVRGSADALRDRLVEDAIAATLARCSTTELALLRNLNWEPKVLHGVAKAVTAAGSGTIAPAPAVDVSGMDVAAFVTHLRTQLAPGDEDEEEMEIPWVLPDFAVWIRHAYARACAERGILTYDGMIIGLAERLRTEDGQTDAPLRGALRARYRAALVDEFQDTDQAQWDILRRVFFESPDHHLYVVGDPKQAIYRFRGANLGVYLAAAAALSGPGGGRFTLLDNRRSDRALLQVLNALWKDHGGPRFRDARILNAPFGIVEENRTQGLGAVVDVRLFDAAALDGQAGEALPVNRAGAEALVARQAALACAELLASGGTLPDPEDGTRRPLRPRDLTILVRKRSQGDLMRAELERIGIPSVNNATQGIFGTPAALGVLAWLDAVAQPRHEGPAKVLALTPLLGWSAWQLERALSEPQDGEDATAAPWRTAWAQLRASLADAAERWPKAGFSTLFEGLLRTHAAWQRVLVAQRDERFATDLRHLQETLHAEDRRARMAPAGLAAWVRAQGHAQDEADEVGLRRVESDADAVNLTTIHASKGLQYGVVLLPFEWSESETREPKGAVIHTPPDRHDGARVVDLHPTTDEARQRAIDAAEEEAHQEGVRLLYVAATRARHKLVLWTGTHLNRKQTVTGENTPLSALIRRPALDALLAAGPSDPQTVSRALDGWRALFDAGLTPDHLTMIPERPRSAPAVPTAPPPTPRPVPHWPLDHAPGSLWRVTSYSALSNGRAVDVDVPSSRLDDAAREESLQGENDDTLDAAHGVRLFVGLAADVDAVPEAPLLEAAPGEGFRGGTPLGDWLHGALEQLDFGSDDAPPHPKHARDGTLREHLARCGERAGVTDPAEHERAERLLPSWLDTPLDVDPQDPFAPPPGSRLRGLSRADRADEIDFDLRLGSGLDPRGPDGRPPRTLRPEGVRFALEASLRDPRFRGKAWVRGLLDSRAPDEAIIGAIAGILTGSMDLLLRLRVDGRPRYYVCDYKTNLIRGSEAVQDRVATWPLPPGHTGKNPPRVRAWHYTPPMLAWEMAHHAYHLQALLYTVATHRLLAQRLGTAYGPDGYDTWVGGHLYLFLRGMDGVTHRGVWYDRWPKATVLALDAALDGADEATIRARVAGAGGA
ncbi:MAG: hypothetical protein RLZZ299_980 [Pseudomonadota bacterium]